MAPLEVLSAYVTRSDVTTVLLQYWRPEPKVHCRKQRTLPEHVSTNQQSETHEACEDRTRTTTNNGFVHKTKKKHSAVQNTEDRARSIKNGTIRPRQANHTWISTPLVPDIHTSGQSPQSLRSSLGTGASLPSDPLSLHTCKKTSHQDELSERPQPEKCSIARHHRDAHGVQPGRERGGMPTQKNRAPRGAVV